LLILLEAIVSATRLTKFLSDGMMTRHGITANISGQPRLDGVMPQLEGAFEADTLRLLRAVLDEAWDALTPEQRSDTFKSDMALRILRLAQQGERDPARLRIAAMLRVAPADAAEKRAPVLSVGRGSFGSRIKGTG
jgi:hypothetical protein